MKKYKNKSIVFCTRSANYILYIKAKRLIENEIREWGGVKFLRFTNTTADGYIYMLMKVKADYIVNFDEDAFFINPSAILNLIDYMQENDIACCGTPDGGVACRGHNPAVINPYFSIFNMKVLRKIYNKKAIINFSYEENKNYIQDNFPKTYQLVRAYNWNEYKFEPYYNFFLWLAANAKVLYLPCYNHNDGLSTVCCDLENNPILIHTWYSREYGVDEFHTRRIDAIIEECYRFQTVVLNITKIDNALYCIDKYKQRIIYFIFRLLRFGKKKMQLCE